MTSLIDSGLPVASSCQGEGVCSMCRVVVEGATTPPDKVEQDCLERNKCLPGERLSCQITVLNDLIIKTKYW
jgi:ferredoxin, 2Fe-2S